MRLDDPELVRREYADEERFSVRQSAWSHSTVSFPDFEAARRYASASPTRAHLVDEPPVFEGHLMASRANAVFVADKT